MLPHQPQSPPSPDRPGRDGLLRLAFERRGTATALRRCRYKLPLQALSPLTLDDGTSYLLLLNPTGGVLGGDHLRTEIAVEENASVCLSTPSATRIYRTASAAAEIDAVLGIGRNATLEYLPDHVIPHPGASLRQCLRIEMAEGARGIFLDNFAVGRAALSERWVFRDYDSRIELLLRGKPIYLNRTKIICGPATRSSGTVTPDCAPLILPATGTATFGCASPDSALSSVVIPSERGDEGSLLRMAQTSSSRNTGTDGSPTAIGAESLPPFRGSELQLRHNRSTTIGALAPEEPVSTFPANSQGMSPETAAPLQIPHQSHPASLGRMSDYSYSGTLLIVADQFTDWRPVVSALRAELESLPEVLGGVSLLTHSGCSARYLAKSAIPFQSATHRLWTAARRQVLHLPPLDLRKY